MPDEVTLKWCQHCSRGYAIFPPTPDDGLCSWWCRDRVEGGPIAAGAGLPYGDDDGEEHGPGGGLDTATTVRLSPL